MPVQFIKGVGPKRAKILEEASIATLNDLVYFLPSRYEDRTKIVPIEKLLADEFQLAKGNVKSLGLFRTPGGMRIFKMKIEDGSGILECLWFNQPFMKRYFKVGDEVILYGKAKLFKNFQMANPEYEIISSEKDKLIHTQRIVPKYPEKKSVSSRFLRSIIFKALEKFSNSFKETLPVNLRAKYKLADIKFAVNNIHFPESFNNLSMAYRRLIFEEFFLLEIAIALQKKEIKSADGISHKISQLYEKFKNNLPYKLTKGQLKAVSDIEADMKSGRSMNRLLEGDVGSGKTVVCSHALILSVANGYQAAIMAPTEILARQHYFTLSELFMKFNLNLRLLTSSTSKNEKEDIKNALKNGNCDIVIGTHALLEEDINFKKLGVVVVDEQHKFGVSQRALIREKGGNPDVLIMTATPIPRSLALTIYGELDISVMRDKPPGRAVVRTYWVEESRREKVYSFLKEEIKKGRQIYIVYPRIEKDENSEIKAAEDMYEKLKNNEFKDFKIGLIHGRLSSEEKEKVFSSFKNHKIDILVSTIVIEVGIDIENASCMVIENAERFGLAQLHQLRGRVGRGEYDSYCILISNPKSKEAALRIKALTESKDGFDIAEADLEMRGQGEFFGTKQHGLPEIRFGNIVSDSEILEEARREAFFIVGVDPDLSGEKNLIIKENLKRRFGKNIDFIKIG